jgi:hypothetical protein
MNFSSGAAYKRYLAYGHSTGVFEKTPGNQPVSIQGKAKKVQHTPSNVSRREAPVPKR